MSLALVSMIIAIIAFLANVYITFFYKKDESSPFIKILLKDGTTFTLFNPSGQSIREMFSIANHLGYKNKEGNMHISSTEIRRRGITTEKQMELNTYIDVNEIQLVQIMEEK